MAQTTTNGGTTDGSVFRQLVYASSILGGGVVGYDYAHWLEVNLIVGALIGSVISTAATKTLYILKDDKDIQSGFVKAGASLGAVAGVIFGISNYGGAEGFFGGLIVGSILGSIAGVIVGTLVSLASLLLLTIGRGPIGLYLRSFTESKPTSTDSPPAVSFLDIDLLLSSLLDSTTLLFDQFSIIVAISFLH